MSPTATETAPLPPRAILARAWPIVLANSTVPLLGLADTAVIGHVGTATDLGAIALGALLFNFVYWGFGFLRMGTTGFVAQADGANDDAEVRATLARALVLAAVLAVALLALQVPLLALALGLLDGSAAVEALTADYFAVRIWGAPATLATYAVHGLFIGLGHTRRVLQVQVALNGLNIVLDVTFAGLLGWGVTGIAAGTVVAEWAALGWALWLAGREVRGRHRDDEPFWPVARLRDPAPLLRLLSANRDLMLRTLLMLGAFAWFANQGARFGDVTLAANHVLLQFISFSAFFLDGFAFVAESLVGRAVGRGDRAAFELAVRGTTRLAAVTALVLAALLGLAGPSLIGALTDLPGVRATAAEYLPYAVAYVALSFAAFQLDGIFIGATRAAAMRDASLLSVAGFLGLWWLLGAGDSNAMLWLAFVGYVVLRALTLLARWPALRDAVVSRRTSPST